MVQAKVVFASSQDPAYPPDAMLDGRPDTFWATSGLYPQQFVVSLPTVSVIDTVALTSYNVRKVVVARSVKSNPTDFEDFSEKELEHDEGKLQNAVVSSDQISAAHIRITITAGYGHF